MSSNLPGHDDDADVDYNAVYFASSDDNHDDCFMILIFWQKHDLSSSSKSINDPFLAMMRCASSISQYIAYAAEKAVSDGNVSAPYDKNIYDNV